MKELTLAQLQLSEDTGRLRAATVGQNSISAALAFDYDNDRYTNEKWVDNQYLLHSGAKCFHQDYTTLIDLDTMEIKTFNY